MDTPFNNIAPQAMSVNSNNLGGGPVSTVPVLGGSLGAVSRFNGLAGSVGGVQVTHSTVPQLATQSVQVAQDTPAITPGQLLQAHVIIGQRLEAYVRNISAGDSQQAAASNVSADDSFNSENLNKLHNMSTSSSRPDVQASKQSTVSQNVVTSSSDRVNATSSSSSSSITASIPSSISNPTKAAPSASSSASTSSPTKATPSASNSSSAASNTSTPARATSSSTNATIVSNSSGAVRSASSPASSGATQQAPTASLLDSKININDVLKGVGPQRELDQSQKMLNDMAAKQRTEFTSADKNTTWAKMNLKQEALPYQTLRGAQRQQAEGVQTYIPKVAPRRVLVPGSAPAAPLASKALQNPNAPANLQNTSSKLVMEQLTKSPFREVTGRQAPTQEAPKMVFASTFTPRDGRIPVIPSINAPMAAAQAADPVVQATALPDAKVAAPMVEAAATGGVNVAQAANQAQTAALAASIVSGQAFMQPGSVAAQQAQLNALVANSTTVQKSNIKEREAIEKNTAIEAKRLQMGLNFGGRPVQSQVPVYSPTLDAIFVPKSKKEIDQHSTPVKMVLSGSVGKLEQDTYNRNSFNSLQQQQGGHPQNGAGDALRKLSQQSRDFYEMGGSEMRFGAGTAKRIGLFAEKNPLAKKEEQQTGSSSSYLHEDNKPKLDASGRLILSLNDRIHMSNIRLAASGVGYESTMNKMGLAAKGKEYAIDNVPQGPIAAVMLKQICMSQGGSAANNSEEEATNAALLMLKMSGDATYEHSTRIVSLALDVADELGVKDGRMRKTIEYGSMFKDIGETDILLQQEPDDKFEAVSRYMGSADFKRAMATGLRDVQLPIWLVNEVRPLSEAEYKQLKAHPERSEQMLYALLGLRYICPTVRAHHERWDGKGFPDGLQGEKIPLPARIISVCDSYDALTNARAGGKAYSVKEACSILEGGSGSVFDPKVVSAFVKVADRRIPRVGNRPSVLHRKS